MDTLKGHPLKRFFRLLKLDKKDISFIYIYAIFEGIISLTIPVGIQAIINLIALNQSFDFVKTRYDSGNTDFYTYLESLNNKNRAEIELVNAQYSIVFRKKILDVYRGML